MKLLNNWMSAVFFILPVFIVTAQNNEQQIPKTDTVYIYKDPLILRKTVIYNQQTNTDRKWMADFFINMSYGFNKTSYCSCDSTFNMIYKNGFTNRVSYGIGTNLSRQYNRFLLTGSIQVLSVRDRLSYNSTTSNNSYTYLNTGLLAGYKLGKGKLQVIPAGGIVLSTLVAGSAKTVSATDLSWQQVYVSHYFYTNTIDITGRLKLLYPFDTNKLFFIEGYILHDMQNITKSDAPIGLKRTLTGINAGLSFLLK
jgi:hypothetical protein